MNKYPFKLSLIIPAYNEEKKIGKDIEEAFSFFKKAKMKAEVIVSTDGVTDGTNDIVKKLQKKYKNLYLLAYKNKIGKGAAIKKGVARAKGKYIMFADSGYCVPYSFILNGIKKIDEGFDCALASRAAKNSRIKIKQPIYRKIGSKIFGFIARNILGIPNQIKDTQCGFKIYRNEIAKKLFFDLQTLSMMFDIEIILLAKRYKYKMVSFPVEWKNDFDTKFNPLTGSITNFKDLYKIKLKYRL
ncbi:MAG: glycosyltransferase [Patescibacteria group bacterium]